MLSQQMDISKLVIKRLEGTLTEEEEIDFVNWIEESYLNESTFFRLQVLKDKETSLVEEVDVNAQLAWEKVKNKLFL